MTPSSPPERPFRRRGLEQHLQQGGGLPLRGGSRASIVALRRTLSGPQVRTVERLGQDAEQSGATGHQLLGQELLLRVGGPGVVDYFDASFPIYGTTVLLLADYLAHSLSSSLTQTPVALCSALRRSSASAGTRTLHRSPPAQTPTELRQPPQLWPSALCEEEINARRTLFLRGKKPTKK